MTLRTKFRNVLTCFLPNDPISACGAILFRGYHSFPKWAIHLLWQTLSAFSKCFPGAGYVKVGGGLGSEGMLSSVLRVRACSRVSGCPSFRCSRMPWRSIWQDVVLQIHITWLYPYSALSELFSAQNMANFYPQGVPGNLVHGECLVSKLRTFHSLFQVFS